MEFALIIILTFLLVVSLLVNAIAIPFAVKYERLYWRIYTRFLKRQIRSRHWHKLHLYYKRQPRIEFRSASGMLRSSYIPADVAAGDVIVEAKDYVAGVRRNKL